MGVLVPMGGPDKDVGTGCTLGMGVGVWVGDGVGVLVGSARVAVGAGVEVGAAATSVAAGGLGWGSGARATNPIDNTTSSAMPAKANMQDSTDINKTRIAPTLGRPGILKCIATPCAAGAFYSTSVLYRLWRDFYA